MSMKLKSTLAATLAATLATGMVVPAMATNKEVNVDELYAAAYEATIKAEETGTQEDIAEARKAIKALEGTDAEFAIGEFSKIVDAPQQKILTEIVDGIAKNNETPNQKSINEIRELILGLKSVDSANWVNTYSSALDKAQQKLIDQAVEAVEKAEKSGLQADIDAAQKLIDTLKTATNNEGVVNWAGDYEEAKLAPLKGLKVSSVAFENEKKVVVEFNKEIDAKTVEVRDFNVYEVENETKQYISGIKVLEDNKSVEINLKNPVHEELEYEIKIAGIMDKTGVEIEETTSTIKYEKAEVKSIEFKNKQIKFVKDESILEHIIIKDDNGRDITDEFTINDFKIESNAPTVLGHQNSDTGIIKNAGNVKANITLLIDGEESNISTGKTDLSIQAEIATKFQGYVISKADLTGKKLSEVKDEEKLTSVKVGDAGVKIYSFYIDQFGEEMPTIVPTYNVSNGNLDIDDQGNITANYVGKANVEIENGDIKSKITIEVKEKSKETTLKLSENNIKLSNATGTGTKTLKMEVLDQHGDKMKEVEANSVTIKGETSELVSVTNGNAGEVEITAKKVGTGRVTLEYTYKVDNVDKILETNVNITSIQAGDFKDYKVVYEAETIADSDSDLDIDSSVIKAGDEDHKLAVAVKEIDEKGNVIGNTDSTVSLKITDKDGTDVTTDLVDDDTTTTINVSGEGVTAGTYKVEVVVEGLTIETINITIKDKAETATTIVIDNTKVIEVTSQYTSYNNAKEKLEEKLMSMINDANDNTIVVFDQYGDRFNTVSTVSLKDVSFTKSPTKAIEEYDVVIKAITIDDVEMEIPETLVRVNFGA